MGTTLGNRQPCRNPGTPVCGKYLRSSRIFAASGKYSLRWCPLWAGGNVCNQSRILCRLGATLIAWTYPPGVESWCAMKWLFGPAAAVALGGAMLVPPPAVADAVADTTQATSTQVVNFAVDESFCPQHGLYGIAHVTVDGTAGMTADQNFIWTTKTAATSIHSVPPAGAVANVTVVYHCNVQVLWWLEPGNSRKVSAALWVNGSGPQPSYTIRPGRQAPQPTPPPTPSPTPIASADVQPAPPPTLPLTPTPPQALQPTPPPAPSQALQPKPALTPTPKPSPALQPTPTPPDALADAQPTPTPPTSKPSPTPTPTPTPTPKPSQALQPTPTPTPSQTHQPTLPPTPTPTPTPSRKLQSTPTPSEKLQSTP